MAVPDLIPVPGTIRDISPTVKYSPYTGLWWMNSIINRVPETAVGWLVAQGWQVTNTYQEEDDGQNYYTMARQTMQSWMILQSLLNEYTQAYNEARAANSIRYNDIVDLWNNTISYSRQQMDVQGNVSDGHVSLYVTQLDEIVSDVETDAADIKSAVEDAHDEVGDQLAVYLPKVAVVETDWDTHAGLARGFLTDLGTTELARINEHFNNLLAKMRQDLVNRGLYMSALVTQMTTRIERERTEAIAKLNDQINREKWENQHRLYQQQMQMRGMVLDGRGKYMSLQMQNGQFLTDTLRQLVLVKMQARLAKAQGRMDIRDREEKLQAYQLDTRNNLIVGLFGFCERREDTYPGLESMTRLVAGLGDASGGWLTP